MPRSIYCASTEKEIPAAASRASITSIRPCASTWPSRISPAQMSFDTTP